MRLRQFEDKDAPYILEWMQDKDITKYFQFDASKVSLESVNEFISNSHDVKENIHMACVNDDDEYLGTVSLKNIDNKNKNAEFAISFRKKAQGTGASKFAVEEITKLGYKTLKLHKIYLNVLSENKRAVRFYEKMGFVPEGEFKQHIFKDGIFYDLSWYRIPNEEK